METSGGFRDPMHGCGTLASPSGFAKGNAMASSSNGKQHALPKHPAHQLVESHPAAASQTLTSKNRYEREGFKKIVQAHWEAKQTMSPTRMWGTTKSTKWGGEERIEGEGDVWGKGEYWNCDSNIKVWGSHEVKRNAAAANHDVHRHDQRTRMVLPEHPNLKKPAREEEDDETEERDRSKEGGRQCTSGVVRPDCCFLEAWGFDLGQRDRQGNPVKLWKPPGQAQMFRGQRSFCRNTERMAETYRTLREPWLRKEASAPAILSFTATDRAFDKSPKVRHEDVGGEAGDMAHPDDIALERTGRTHGSRSHNYHDCYGHASKREGARLALGMHAPSNRTHADGHPMKDNLELSPGSVYNLKFRKFGEAQVRTHMTASETHALAPPPGTTRNVRVRPTYRSMPC